MWLLIRNDIIMSLSEGRSLGWLEVIRGGGAAVGLAEDGGLAHYLIYGHISTRALVMGHHSIGCITGSGNTLHFSIFLSSVWERNDKGI